MVAAMKRFARPVAGLLLLLAGVAPATPAPRGQVARAAFASGRLLLLTEDGALFSLREGAASAERIPLPEPGIDLCRSGATAFLLTGGQERAAPWTLRRLAGRAWGPVTVIDGRGERLLAMGCGGAGPVLVTSRRLIDLSGPAPREVRLSEEVKPPLVLANVAIVGGGAFVGFNAGEWGGGLQRIDRRNGRVTRLERNAGGGLCGGPLNTACDPVNAIAEEPWNPACAAAAVGLVHMLAHGRLVEICGDRIERLFFKPLDDGWGKVRAEELDDGEPPSTVAFFGLARSGGSLWAVGLDGLYRLRGPGRVEFTGLPEFRDIGGFRVSFDLPGVVLVLSGINGHASMSGAVPLMAVR
jgi:hypothetical protein